MRECVVLCDNPEETQSKLRDGLCEVPEAGRMQGKKATISGFQCLVAPMLSV